MNTSPRNTLKKNERLKSKKLSEELFEGKHTINLFPFKVIYKLVPDLPADGRVQAMFISPKRNLKKAHDRNKVKRLMRESFRRLKHELVDYLKQRNKKLALALIYLGKSDELLLSESDEKIGNLLNKVLSKCS